jgi:peptide/nickel transport system permease protein
MSQLARKKIEKLERLAELANAHAAEHGESLWREAFKRVRRNPSAIAGAIILGLFILIAVVGPFLVPYDPAQTGVGKEFGLEIREGQGLIPGPNGDFWFGLDHNGRDMFSRMIVGARQTLLVGVVATGIGLTLGCLIGGLAGAAYGLGGKRGKALDNVLMRFIDMLLAMPGLLLAISIVALLGPSLITVMIAVGFISVPIFARLLRGSMISQSNAEYVIAATSLGVRNRKIAISHILPNSIAPVLVQATLTLATAIIEAAGLSFLGLGNPDSGNAEWGTMLADGLFQSRFEYAPHLSMFPAVAIIITALGFTLLGEAMREALDPKLRK